MPKLIPINTLCEACERAPATIVEKCDDPVEPYFVCAPCHQRLHARALRPLEWYNLSKRHGWYQFLLHDDFYDQDGVAAQPEEDITGQETYLVPSFDVVRTDSETLLDWCITRWRLEEPEIGAWKGIGYDKTIHSLTSRFSASNNAGIRGTILEIIGRTSDARSAEFVRYCWGEYPDKLALGPLVQATARSIPFQEGFDRAIAALAALEPAKRRSVMYCLGYFASPAGLDWIEANIYEPTTDQWGYLAAMCQPSWPRLASWLRQGRPLSLVAVDALIAIARLPTPMLKERDVRLRDAPFPSILESTLREYEQRDNVPRVSQRVAALLKLTDRITESHNGTDAASAEG